MSKEPSEQFDNVHRLADDLLMEKANAQLKKQAANTDEAAYVQTLRQMTDAELAAQALLLRAKTDATLQEMIRRLLKSDPPSESV